MYYVVAYDIVQDKRRNRVMSTLKDYGVRVQYSVFECELDSRRLHVLTELLDRLIDRKRDKIHIYPMCETCFFRGERLGVGVAAARLDDRDL